MQPRRTRSAVDARGATMALVLIPGDDGSLIGTVALDGEIAGADLTRSVERLRAGAPGGAGRSDSRVRSTTRTWRAGRVSGWPWPAPTSWAPCAAH